MIWLILIIYPIGFSYTYRLTLRIFLTRWESVNRYTRDISMLGDAGPYFRAATVALVWFPFIFGYLLSVGVKSDQQLDRERKDKEAQQRKEQTEFKRRAQEMNIPGWEHL